MSEAPQGYASIGKFLSVSELRSNPKTKRWALWSDGDDYLGVILWHGAWRCYVLFPSENTLFHAKCLTDIAVFLKKQTDEHRSSKKNHDSVVQASNAAERPARTDGKENGTPDTPPESSVQTPRGTSASRPDGEPASFLDRWSKVIEKRRL